PSTNMNVKVRPATRGDCKEISRMISELAVYEKISHMLGTAELTKKYSSSISFSSLVSVGFPIVGYALYFYTYSTWKGRSVYLEDLYVMPDFRGKGIGKGLLSKVAEVGKKKQCVRLQLSVLDWNTPSRDFYAAKGAQDITASEGWRSLRFVGQDLDNLANEAPKDCRN
uniref:Spermidine/spermine N1-acetyltransferase family member 2b n=1 Tax=Gasterosteus aculeatus TaxID=69293 RepID=G3QAU4_GASAC